MKYPPKFALLIAVISAIAVLLAACGTAPPAGTSTGVVAPTTAAHAPSPAPAIRPSDGPLPYSADWSSGLDGWTGNEDWAVSTGMLLARGEERGTQAGIVAPIDLAGVDSYAVEAEIQRVRNSDGGALSGVAGFGVVARADEEGVGFGAGSCVSAGIYVCAGNQPGRQVAVLWSNEDFDQDVLDIQPFTSGDDWHTYRLEVRGPSLAVLIDGKPVLSGTDNRYLDGGHVGLWSDRTQISVRSFTVTSLSDGGTGQTLPYDADWSDGLAGWGGTAAWAARDGILVSSGEDFSRESGVVAPLDLTGVEAYAVEADIRLLRYRNSGLPGGMASFGIVVRSQQDGRGYGAGHCVAVGRFDCSPDQPDNQVAVLWTAVDGGNAKLAAGAYRPGDAWHRYRVEVRGNALSLFIDEAAVLHATDNTYLDGRRVGLWSNQCELEVRDFQVTEL